jgi:hypothetical protein
VETSRRSLRRILITGGIGLLVAGVSLCVGAGRETKAGPLFGRHADCGEKPCASDGHQDGGGGIGMWYWIRSPEEEKRVAASLFVRYCIRCHSQDGRGAWDIPDVPNFTDERWQDWHTDAELAQSILRGRGAVMPPFRGTLTLEEAWAMARHVRTFRPSTQASRPDFKKPSK